MAPKDGPLGTVTAAQSIFRMCLNHRFLKDIITSVFIWGRI